MGHGRVNVALDDYRLTFLGNRLAGQVEREQRLLFVEQQRVERVQVLGRDRIVQSAPTERNRPALRVTYREEHPLTKEVVRATLLLGHADDARRLQLLF